MKNKRSIFICTLTGIMMISGCLTSSAENVINANKLKSGLLLNENNSLNIYDYNTNNDNTVNVLDLCRAKRELMTDKPVVNDAVKLELGSEQISYDNKYITIPVVINQTSVGLSTAEFSVNYNSRYFTLKSVQAGDFNGSSAWATGGSSAYFTAGYNGQKITEDGTILYLEFEAISDVPAASYEFSLYDIKGYVTENWKQEMLSSDKCSEMSHIKYVTFGGASQTTSITTTEITTTTTPPTVTTTTEPTTVTTTTEPTTVTTTTEPTTVTTITEPTLPPPDFLGGVEKEIVDLVNQYRMQNSMSALTASENLCKAACVRAQELSVSFEINRPGGKTLDELFSEYNTSMGSHSYVYTATQTSAGDVMSAIIEGKDSSFDTAYFDKIGVGHYYSASSQYKDYWVIFVGR